MLNPGILDIVVLNRLVNNIGRIAVGTDRGILRGIDLLSQIIPAGNNYSLFRYRPFFISVQALPLLKHEYNNRHAEDGADRLDEDQEHVDQSEPEELVADVDIRFLPCVIVCTGTFQFCFCRTTLTSQNVSSALNSSSFFS